MIWWIFAVLLFAAFSYPKHYYTGPSAVAGLRGSENKVEDYFCIGIKYADSSQLGGPVEHYCFGIPFKFSSRKIEGTSNVKRANFLIESFCRKNGIEVKKLDLNYDVSFGSFGFHYEPSTNLLTGRVYISLALITDSSAEWLEAYRKMEATLNDPMLGGMFDTGGGIWQLNEKAEAFYLIKAFDVTTAQPETVISGMDPMIDVMVIWIQHWFVEVSQIMHGEAPPRTQFISAKEWREKNL